MLLNYFTSALRYLGKNKSYAMLNAFCLSIGLACFALITLWVTDEISYDKFHSKHDRTFRVVGKFTSESDQFEQAVTPPPLGPALLNDLPEIEQTVRIDPNEAVVISENYRSVEPKLLFVDQSFFSVFDFKVLSGNVSKLVTDPYTLVLSESMAKKYFGTTDVIGKTLRIFQFDRDSNGAIYNITGVVEDCPGNSHIQYNALGSFKTLEVYNPQAATADGWFINGYYTYALLKPGAKPEALEEKFPKFLEKYIGERTSKWKVRYDYFLQPVSDIHLKSNLRYELSPTSSIAYITTFSAVAIIVLLLACINYINLSTAQAVNRFKEIGVRKTMGALKNQLILQYLVESCVIALLSLVISLLWIELSKPVFETISQKNFDLYTPSTIAMLLSISMVTGIVSGLYPAFVLTSFKPSTILRGQFKAGQSGLMTRKALVVVQFVITIFIVTGIFVIQSQFEYIQNKDLGFNEEKLIVLSGNGSRDIENGYDAFAEEVRSKSSVVSIARSNSMIAGGLGNSVADTEDAQGRPVNGTVFALRIDHDYIDTYGMKLIAGRNFSRDSGTDSTKSFIVNEAVVRTFGWKNAAEAIGKPFHFRGIDGQVIGVVKDFHFNSLQHKIEPVAIWLLNQNFSRTTIRFTGSENEFISDLQKTWNRHFPNSIFDYRFADQSLQSQYQAEQRLANLFKIFSTISVLIACIGLFALVSFTVENRTKEIGIRKVLGATVNSVVTMISKEFLALVVIACIISMPVSYILVSKWLEGFAYHVEIGALVFIAAAALIISIAGLTIFIRAFNAASVNPVNSLKNE